MIAKVCLLLLEPLFFNYMGIYGVDINYRNIFGPRSKVGIGAINYLGNIENEN